MRVRRGEAGDKGPESAEFVVHGLRIGHVVIYNVIGATATACDYKTYTRAEDGPRLRSVTCALDGCEQV